MLSLTEGAKQLRRQFELRLQSLNTLRCMFTVEQMAVFVGVLC